MEQVMNKQNSLALIEEMINKAKNNFSESGTLFILWGFVILFCSVTQFIGNYFFKYEQASAIWMLTWLASIFQIFYLRRQHKNKKVRTYTDDILKYMWITFIVCFVLLVFILIFQKSYVSIIPAILVVYGIPTFLSGIILKFKSLVTGGICCWILAVLCVFTGWDFQQLYIATAGIIAWIIPGFNLRKKFIKENKTIGAL